MLLVKLIGILGGTSWPSTVLPYRLINRQVERHMGRNHSARIALYSIDYHEIRACYSTGWGQIPGILLGEIRTLLGFSPDCWMIANSTLHKIYDQIEPELPPEPPMFHAVKLVRSELLASGVRKALLLGTRFTMEDGYYADPLRRAGIEVVIPLERERERIGEILAKLADGAVESSFSEYLDDLIAHHAQQGCEAAILACSELPLVVSQAAADIAVIDPIALQCRACVDFALAP